MDQVSNRAERAQRRATERAQQKLHSRRDNAGHIIRCVVSGCYFLTKGQAVGEDGVMVCQRDRRRAADSRCARKWREKPGTARLSYDRWVNGVMTSGNQPNADHR